MFFSNPHHLVKRHGYLLALLLFTAVFSCTSPDSFDIVSDENLESESFMSRPIAGQYIIVLSSDFSDKQLKYVPSYDERTEIIADEIVRKFVETGISKEDMIHVYGATFFGFAAQLSDSSINYFKNHKDVESVEQDQVFALGSRKAGSARDNIRNATSGQTMPWGVAAVGGATDAIASRVWIIDTGVDMDHEDLNTDEEHSRSFLSGPKPNQSPDDKHGHGTHVAGTIAAIDNNIGVVGVAAGATVVSIRVLDRTGSGSVSGIIKGVDYTSVHAMGEVVNMSLGTSMSYALDLSVITAAERGVLFALAAGNESWDANYLSPARVNHANVYTISAMNENFEYASFSNYGNPPIGFCAPGVSIPSLWKGNKYNTISGTSMAAPHVAGLLAIQSLNSMGVVLNDPDGSADPIAHK